MDNTNPLYVVGMLKKGESPKLAFLDIDDGSLRQIQTEKQKEQAIMRSIQPKLFNPERLAIMKILYQLREAEFKDIQEDLGLTAGNLASHFRALEQLGYVAYSKDFVGRRQRTIYKLTPEGKKAFREFVRILQKSLSEVVDLNVR